MQTEKIASPVCALVFMLGKEMIITMYLSSHRIAMRRKRTNAHEKVPLCPQRGYIVYCHSFMPYAGHITHSTSLHPHNSNVMVCMCDHLH